MKFKLLDHLPVNCVVCYQPFLYNEPKFLKGNNDFIHHHYYWVDEIKNQAHVHIVFTVHDDIAYSNHKLPFGGLEASIDFPEKEIALFLKSVESKLIELGVKQVRVHQAPDAYADQSAFTFILTALGYEVIQNRVFHSIAVDNSDLYSRMHKMEQRKINKCIQGKAEFKQIKRGKKKIFQWIERHRTLDYKPPSMTWVDLENTSERNPKSYLVFGVYMDGWLLAATVAVKVNDNALYHFMPASCTDFQHYRKYSPMVMLVNEMYKWCANEGIKLLDLGTSYVDMKTKDSLVHFKENIGGKPNEALSWEKTLS